LDSSGWSLSELSRRAKLSRQTLYEIENRKISISPKTWAKLKAAEEEAKSAKMMASAGNGNVSATLRLKGGTVHVSSESGRDVIRDNTQPEKASPAPSSKFEEYLAFLRACREEAERLAAGDPSKIQEIFDKMLAGWLAK
jgi:transcriptional regulator with XRE-family HTH domain